MSEELSERDIQRNPHLNPAYSNPKPVPVGKHKQSLILLNNTGLEKLAADPNAAVHLSKEQLGKIYREFGKAENHINVTGEAGYSDSRRVFVLAVGSDNAPTRIFSGAYAEALRSGQYNSDDTGRSTSKLDADLPAAIQVYQDLDLTSATARPQKVAPKKDASPGTAGIPLVISDNYLPTPAAANQFVNAVNASDNNISNARQHAMNPLKSTPEIEGYHTPATSGFGKLADLFKSKNR